MSQASRLASQVMPATRGHSLLQLARPVHAQQTPGTSTQHFLTPLQRGMVVAADVSAVVLGDLCNQVFSLPALVSPSMNQDKLQQRLPLPSVAPATITGVILALVMMEKFKDWAWRAFSSDAFYRCFPRIRQWFHNIQWSVSWLPRYWGQLL